VLAYPQDALTSASPMKFAMPVPQALSHSALQLILIIAKFSITLLVHALPAILDIIFRMVCARQLRFVPKDKH
jgi:hypothetical protein